MRELKFRFYDHKLSKDMIYQQSYETRNVIFNKWEITPKCSPLMQYTGLKDKNGREIYEGDIILGDSYGEYPLIIKWDNEYTGFYCHDPKGNEDDHLNMIEAANGKIIGNIYENPELIKN
jgi:uncharacterized phage protein (TIGR01671 family)